MILKIYHHIFFGTALHWHTSKMVEIPSAYDSLTYALGSNPSNGSASLSGSTVTYTPAANYNGTDSFTFTVSDGMATSEIAEAQIAITAVNDLPVLEDITVTSVEDETSIILLSGIDVDGDSLTFIIDTGASLGTPTLNGSDVVYIPQPDYHGIDTFSYTALDGFGLSNRAEVSIVLTPVNDAPSVDSLSSSGNTGEAQIVTLSGYDPDGDALSYLLTKQPDQGDVVLSGSTVVYTPNSGFVGTDRITYLANDGQAVSAMASISFTVGSSGEIIPESATPVDSTSVDLSGPVLTILPGDFDEQVIVEANIQPLT